MFGFRCFSTELLNTSLCQDDVQTLDNNKDSTDNNPSAAIAVALQESTFWQERMARFLESLTSITEKGHLKVDYTKKLEQCRLAPNVAAAAKLLVEVADGYLDSGTCQRASCSP